MGERAADFAILVADRYSALMQIIGSTAGTRAPGSPGRARREPPPSGVEMRRSARRSVTESRSGG
jgi:hypothetical protein